MNVSKWPSRIARLDLVAALLVMVALELAVNRLALPELRPRGDAAPLWFRGIDKLAAFIFHLATLLGLGAITYHLHKLVRQRDVLLPVPRATVGILGALFVGLTAFAVVSPHPEGLSFHLETSFFALLFVLTLAFLLRPGDLWTKLGLGLVLLPFAVHYAGSLAALSAGPDGWAMLSQVRHFGHVTLAGAAIASPLCFGPRPFRWALSRPTPVALAAFVGALSAIILRRHHLKGSELAQAGLGIEFGPAAPTSTIALYVIAVGAIAYTLASNLSSAARTRRQIGMGFALVVLAGYAFEWPLQLASAAMGVIAILRAQLSVAKEERDLTDASPFLTPPIADDTWRRYAHDVARTLAADAPSFTRTGHDETTTFVGRRHDTSFSMRMQRSHGSVRNIEISFGAPAQTVPPWTLWSRPEGVAAIGRHPAPPHTPAPIVKLGHAGFDRRFVVRDAAQISSQLWDETLANRATAVLDGWLAIWPAQRLLYSVAPGRGAPLDHPVPISELAIRDSYDDTAVHKLLSVLDVLAVLAAKTLALPTR